MPAGLSRFHILILCDRPIPAGQLRSFGRWLVKDWQDFGLGAEPEVFPAQDSIKGKHGNAIRLPGLHHTYQHYSRIWDGKGWARGEKAVEMIVATTGDPIGLIPAEAKEYERPSPRNPTSGGKTTMAISAPWTSWEFSGRRA